MDSAFVSRINSKPNINFHDAYSYLEYKIDTIGKKITLDAGYLYQKNRSSAKLISDYFINDEYQLTELINNNLISKSNVFTSSLDLELPYKNFEINIGGKITTSNTNNDLKQYFNTTLNLETSNVFDYTENTQAVYGSFFKKLGKWDFKAGLRMENTQTKGKSITLNQTNNNSRLKLFPTLYLNYKSNENNVFGANYSRRIKRPNYDWLNPFRRYLSPTFYSEGNPFLKPDITDNYTVFYEYKKLYNEIWFSKTSNAQRNIIIVSNDSNIQIAKPDNFITQYVLGFYQSYSFDKSKWWKSYMDLSIRFSKEKYNNINVLDKEFEDWSFTFGSKNSFVLNIKKTVLAEFNYSYSSPRMLQAIKWENSHRLQLGLTVLFLDKNLKTSIILNDVLKDTKSKGKSIDINGIATYFDNYYDLKSLKLSLQYNFGKSMKSKNIKFSNQEEKNRL